MNYFTQRLSLSSYFPAFRGKKLQWLQQKKPQKPSYLNNVETADFENIKKDILCMSQIFVTEKIIDP